MTFGRREQKIMVAILYVNSPLLRAGQAHEKFREVQQVGK